MTISAAMCRNFEDQPWPAFPADLMSIAIVAATQRDGVI